MCRFIKMPNRLRLRNCALRSAFLYLGFINSAGAEQVELPNGADFYLGAAFRSIMTFSPAEITTDDVRQQVAGNYFALMSNADGVLSQADAVDYLRVVSNKYSFSITKEPARYDLDRDGVVTQAELEVFFSKDAWGPAYHLYGQGATFEEATVRFWQKLGEQTARIRGVMGAAENGNIPVVDPKGGWTGAEETARPKPVPYFDDFDIDGDAAVTFEEFTEPLWAAVAASDLDADGLFSDDEINRVRERFILANEALEGNGFRSVSSWAER